MKNYLSFLIVVSIFWAGPVWAANCYSCAAGSAAYCRDYCKYPGKDSFAQRKQCEQAGCKISGTSTCPTAVNYKVCSVGGTR